MKGGQKIKKRVCNDDFNFLEKKYFLGYLFRDPFFKFVFSLFILEKNSKFKILNQIKWKCTH